MVTIAGKNIGKVDFMKRFALIAMAVLLVAGLAGCASMGKPVAPAGLTLDAWVGQWVEYWPEGDDHDIYSVIVADDGRTLQLTPVTNAGRQEISQIEWDGRTLKFILRYDNKIWAYNLTMSDDGKMLYGMVRREDGDVRTLKWVKEGNEPWPPRHQLSIDYELKPKEWVGDWLEQWPDANDQDRYRLALLPGRDTPVLMAITRPEKQALKSVTWDGRRLTFILDLDYNLIHYELVAKNKDLLIGVASSPEGKVKKITWRRVADVKPVKFELASWAGTWEETWPNREPNDQYQLKLVGENGIEILPLSNAEKQTIEAIQFTAESLRFKLTFNDNPILYTLLPEDADTLRGTVELNTGRIRTITWKRTTGGNGGKLALLTP